MVQAYRSGASNFGMHDELQTAYIPNKRTPGSMIDFHLYLVAVDTVEGARLTSLLPVIDIARAVPVSPNSSHRVCALTKLTRRVSA